MLYGGLRPLDARASCEQQGTQDGCPAHSLLPAIGAVVLIFTGVKAAKQVALAVSLITFALALATLRFVHYRGKPRYRSTRPTQDGEFSNSS